MNSKELCRLIVLMVGLGFMYLAAIFIIVGLCTNYWLEIRERDMQREDTMVHFGLHRICFEDSDRCTNPGSSYDEQDSLPTVIGLVVAGGFIAIGASLANMFNFFNELLRRYNAIISAVTATAAVVSGILLMVGVIMFSDKVEPYSYYIQMGQRTFFGFSFGLTAAAVGMMFIGGIMNGVHVGLLFREGLVLK